MMRYLKHWKYQCLFGAPFVPWVMVQWITWIYDTMIALGWTHGRMDGPIVVTGIFAILAMIIFIIGYVAVHEAD